MPEPRVADTATPDSIAHAKAHQQAERQRITRATGLVIADEPAPFDSYTIICPNCLAPIGAETRGKADRAFAHHFVTAHKAHLRLV